MHLLKRVNHQLNFGNVKWISLNELCYRSHDGHLNYHEVWMSPFAMEDEVE